LFDEDSFVRGPKNGSTSFGLWLAEKLQNPITDPEFRASAKGTISYYGAGIRPVFGLKFSD
jgi:hypothetical protein